MIVNRRRTDDTMAKKDKQRSTKHTHTTKDRITRTPLKTGVESGAPEWYTVTRRVNLVTNPV
jgi:hypothetical protein